MRLLIAKNLSLRPKIQIMRKTVLLYAAIASLLLAACNNDSEKPAKTDATTQTAAPAQPEPAKVDSPAAATPAVWAGVQEVTDAAFEQKVLKNPGLTIVDFSAVWCGPCKVLKPLFKEAASSYEGKASFATIDVDENPTVSEQYKVQSIPLLLFFKNGKVVHKIVGLISAKELNSAIDKALKA